MIRKTALSRPEFRHLALFGTLLLLAAAALTGAPARAQKLDSAELEDLVAPIALYPDDVLGIILPASTFPLDIVRAARFIEELEDEPSLQPDDSWDDSIVALLNYPEVVQMMDEDLDWTWALGEAVLTDQAAVLDAAQNFRRRAYAAGNLRSDDKQTVVEASGAIEITPADPQVVYIPVYEPREVIVYHARPAYHYYPIGYPLYYYPYPVGYSFSLGYFWGVTSYYSLGWDSHFLHVRHQTNRLHPYYLNSYYLYTPYYPRNNVNISVTVDNYADVWRPSPRRGSRPRTATVESRSSTARRPTTTTVESQPNVSSGSRTVTGGQQRATTLGGVAARSSVRPETTRSVQSPAVTSSQTRRIGTSQAAPATSAPATQVAPATSAPATLAAPATRQRTIGQTTTPRYTSLPQTSAPASPATQSSQGSTRRAQPEARSAAPPPQSTRQGTIGSVNQSTGQPPPRSAPAERSQGSRTRQR